MKLKAIEFDGSSHKKVVTETGKEIGLFYLDVDGFYYFEPKEGGGVFSSNTLNEIVKMLIKINKPSQDELEEFFRIKVGEKVIVVVENANYSTYEEMFKKLKFKNTELNIFSLFRKKNKKWRDVVFTVFNRENHPYQKDILFAIRDEEGNEFLFGERGIKRYSNCVKDLEGYAESPDFLLDELKDKFL